MNDIAEIFAIMIPIVGMVCLFSFLAVAKLSDNRRRQDEARAKFEFLRKMAEGGSFDVQKYMEYEQVEADARRQRRVENLKLGGLILVAVGIALAIFFRSVSVDDGAPVAIGFIPLFIGLALFAGAWLTSRSRRGKLAAK